MAQQVGYFQNNVTFEEGPFVMVCIGGWRIEVELVGWKCPVLPDSSIYDYLQSIDEGFGKSLDQNRVAKVVDLLNAAVRAGRIVCDAGWWVMATDVTRFSIDRN